MRIITAVDVKQSLSCKSSAIVVKNINTDQIETKNITGII